MKSGDPPAQVDKPETAVTDKPPSPAPGDSRTAELPPRERRDIEKSSLVLPIVLIVGGLFFLLLCVCGGPALLLFGAIPWVAMRHDVAHEQARNAQRAAVVEADAAMEMRGRAKGAADAPDAIAKGMLLLKEYPPVPGPAWHGEYIKLLKEKCNCDYEVVNAPKLDKEQEAGIRDWNDAMRAELRARHGPTILEDLQKEAEQHWRDRVKKKGKK
jgi:hypothetical protein